MISDTQLSSLSAKVGVHLRDRGLQLVTAESCTGGWIGKVLTDIPGSSAWYAGGVVSYSNALKQSLIGVRAQTLAAQGAVSEATAREMAAGALTSLGGHVAIAVTGIAGPDGGQPSKPVGTVWFAWASRRAEGIALQVAHELLSGDRDAIRRAAVDRALQEILRLEL